MLIKVTHVTHIQPFIINISFFSLLFPVHRFLPLFKKKF